MCSAIARGSTSVRPRTVLLDNLAITPVAQLVVASAARVEMEQSYYAKSVRVSGEPFFTDWNGDLYTVPESALQC